jgi:hypothetical protein
MVNLLRNSIFDIPISCECASSIFFFDGVNPKKEAKPGNFIKYNFALSSAASVLKIVETWRC